MGQFSAAINNQPLRIRYQPDGSRMQGAMRMVRELLSTGNLDAFAALEARPNSVPVFTGFGTLGLMDTDMIGGGSAGAWDATVFDLAGLDAYADRPAAYRVMVIDAGGSRSAVFQKVTNAAGDWSQPIYFTGKDGRIGDKGEPGNDFEPDAIGLLSERAGYDHQPAGFAFLATDAAALYFRQGAAGEWSAPIPFGAGKPGADGLSAYQIAVQEGFAGTQAEWLASLKGRDGDPGRQGEPGLKGEPGQQGEPGQKGEPGKDGTDASVTELSIRAAGGAIKAEVDAALALKAGVYTGSERDEVNFPIGAYIGVYFNLIDAPRNAIAMPRMNSTFGYQIEGTGTLLTGVWRNRGVSGAVGTARMYLMQRVA